jgi:type IV secretory pathway VirB4 component
LESKEESSLSALLNLLTFPLSSLSNMPTNSNNVNTFETKFCAHFSKEIFYLFMPSDIYKCSLSVSLESPPPPSGFPKKREKKRNFPHRTRKERKLSHSGSILDIPLRK